MVTARIRPQLLARLASVLWMAACTAVPAVGQSRIVGTVYDSLSARRPLPNAVVVLVERSLYATTDSMGRFRFDSVPAGHYRLDFLHPVLDSFDLAAPPRPIDVADSGATVVELATPSAESAYLRGCAVRLSEVANKADVAAYLRISTSCAKLARRAAQQTAATREPDLLEAGSRADPQILQPVVVRDSARSLSPMAMYGFGDRRRLGLGAYFGPEELAKHRHETLAALLGTVRGVRVEWGASGQPEVFLRGNKEGSCVPTYFIDGALYYLPLPILHRADAFRDISAIAPPWTIKGIEVYSNPGAMPAQFDYSSSTGCGSIVIWTR